MSRRLDGQRGSGAGGAPWSPIPCSVLLEDAELRAAVPWALRAQAVEECVTRTVALRPGAWRSAAIPDELGDGIGLLILEGLVLRRTGVDGRFGAELLGKGDLLRPWQGAGDALALALTTTRRVLLPTRVAVLDREFALRAGHYPQLVSHLIGRATNRSRNLAVLMAIAHQPRVDTRLHTLFWHLAGRWGRKRNDGVLVPLSLTHAALADLTAARRPTVSRALADLARRGILTSTADGWLLAGDPPGELLEGRSGPRAAGPPPAIQPFDPLVAAVG